MFYWEQENDWHINQGGTLLRRRFNTLNNYHGFSGVDMKNISIMGDQTNVIHRPFRRGIARRIIGRIKYWNERRQAMRQLAAMSDRLLQDIGIERHEIYQSVYRGAAPVKMVPERTGKPEVSEELRKAA